MTAGQTSELGKLRARLIAACEPAGVKTALAKEFGVSTAAVSQWLSGKNDPKAETALRLLNWVQEREAQQKTPGDATNTTRGRKTRQLNHSNEKESRPRRGS